MIYYIFIFINMDASIKGINKIIFEYCYFPRVFEEELIKQTIWIKFYCSGEPSYRDNTFIYSNNYYGYTRTIKKHSIYEHWTLYIINNIDDFKEQFKCEFKR